MSEHSRYRTGLWLPDEKPMYGAQPILGHPLTPTAAWVFNEGSGLEAFDLSGKGNVGVFKSGAEPSWHPEGIDFGADDAILVNDSPELTFGTDDFSICVLFRADTIPAYASLVCKGGTAATEWSFYTASSVLRMYSGSGINVLDSVALSLNTWYQACITRKDSTLRLWKNLVNVATDYSAGGDLSTTKKLSLGSQAEGTSRFWDGIIKYCYIWDYCITKSQISQLYHKPYSWLAHPMEAELMYAAPPAGVMSPYYYEQLLAGAVM